MFDRNIFTCWIQDKTVVILRTAFPLIFLNETICLLWKISLKFVSDWQEVGIGSGYGMSPVQRESMMAEMADAYMRHPASMC